MSSSIEIVDDYLAKWNQYIHDTGHSLIPVLNKGKPAFETALSALLEARDPGAASRLVFITIVQGFFPLDSKLGQATAAFLGPDCPVRKTPQGHQVYAASDLFHWWERNAASYEAFPILDEWIASDFAQKTMIPRYRQIASEQTA
jgi:hypothetical protein